jgi:hypothetical protein
LPAKFSIPLFGHIIFSLLTVGLWLPVWLFISWKQHLRARCLQCGKKRTFVTE